MDIVNFGLVPTGFALLGVTATTAQTLSRDEIYLKQAKATEVADYVLGSTALGLVALVTYVSYALKIYFDKRLEMSIRRQELDIKNQQEMIDRANKQFDVLLTNILGSINEEKDRNLEVLERIGQTEKEVAYALHTIITENHSIALQHITTNNKIDQIMVELKSAIDPTKKFAV